MNKFSIILYLAMCFSILPMVCAAQEKIAFHSLRDGGKSEIYVMNADGTSQARLTNNPNSISESEPSINLNVGKIVFTSFRYNADHTNNNINIYLMNADGTGETQLTNNLSPSSQPAFSPDGSKIVFTSFVSSSTTEIYIMNADGTNKIRLTNNSVNDAYPSFSPDGSKIVFTNFADGNGEIYVMNADGSNPTRLTNNTAMEGEPVFSPDGSRIAFSSNRDGGLGNPEIYIMDADGTNQTRLTNNPTSDSKPSFSPDGSKIAFQSDRNGSINQIFVMNSADGTNQMPLTNSAVGNYAPSWSGVQNNAPTITAANGVTRARDAGVSNSLIATVSDAEDAENTLSVMVNGTSSATSNGVTVSGISVDSSGFVTANIEASCGATNASFILQVTDSGALFNEATLSVGVTNETGLPVIALPSDIVTNLPLNSTATGKIVNFTVSATDNCDANPTVTAVPASGSTFPVGTTTVNVTATDASGNTATGSFTVTVSYNFAGFFQPVDNLPTVNTVTGGQAIPVKFSLSGNKGLNIFAAGFPVSQQITCVGGAPVSSVEETVTAGSSSLSYDPASDRYIFVWKTEKAWKGTCRQLIVKLNDGTLHAANFQFK